jgi:hypothetical protein
MVKLELKLHTHDVPPQDLLDKIDVERIVECIKKYWGTKWLAGYLDDLSGNTRNNTRHGFSEDTGAAIIELTLLNDAKCVELGEEDFTDSVFLTENRWQLPKNF